MKKSLFFNSIILCLLIIWTSCEDSNKNISGTANIKQINTSDDYFPLHTGIKNEYSIIYSNPFKHVEGMVVMKIDDKEQINDKVYFKMMYVYSGLPEFEIETYYYRKTEDGYFAINGINKLNPEYLDIKLPLEIGTNWRSFTPHGQFEYNVDGVETLELKDRKYKDCIKISMQSDKGIHGYFYLAKGIGMVKQVVHSNRDKSSFEYTLLNYNN